MAPLPALGRAQRRPSPTAARRSGLTSPTKTTGTAFRRARQRSRKSSTGAWRSSAKARRRPGRRGKRRTWRVRSMTAPALAGARPRGAAPVIHRTGTRRVPAVQEIPRQRGGQGLLLGHHQGHSWCAGGRAGVDPVRDQALGMPNRRPGGVARRGGVAHHFPFDLCIACGIACARADRGGAPSPCRRPRVRGAVREGGRQVQGEVSGAATGAGGEQAAVGRNAGGGRGTEGGRCGPAFPARPAFPLVSFPALTGTPFRQQAPLCPTV